MSQTLLFPGVLERPFAGDFNLDGITDIGLMVPNRDGARSPVLSEAAGGRSLCPVRKQRVGPAGRQLRSASQRSHGQSNSNRCAASLYTAEFYDLCRSRLTPDGVVTQWVPLYESNSAAVKCELATFLQAFPRASLWSGQNLATGHDLVVDGAILTDWLRDAQINRDCNLRLQYLAGLPPRLPFVLPDKEPHHVPHAAVVSPVADAGKFARSRSSG